MPTPKTRQEAIRRTLDAQYQAGAANEILVATLRHEMSNLTHNHRWTDGTRFTGKPVAWGKHECMYCFCGVDEYLMNLEDILAKVRASETESDQLLERTLTPSKDN
jgi:hypothetical protein